MEARYGPHLRSTWPGTDVAEALGKPDLALLNDADAAAVAEQRLGLPLVVGTVLVITVGTGLGSGVGSTRDGWCRSNWAASSSHAWWRAGNARKRTRSASRRWTCRHGRAGQRSPGRDEQAVDANLIVVGGGLTEHWDTFSPLLKASAPLCKATFGAD